MEHRLAILIPFRNRLDHLKKFIQRIQQLPNLPDHKIIVVEQADDKPFNRGKLLNVGYLLNKDKFDYFIFHDVDMLPDDNVDYSYSPDPTHLATKTSQFGYRVPYAQYFGGVTLIPTPVMEAANGFSNEFWGWGGEDDKFYERVIRINPNIRRRDCVFLSLGHERGVRGPHKSGEFHTKEKTGLHNCEYKLVGKREFIEIECLSVEL